MITKNRDDLLSYCRKKEPDAIKLPNIRNIEKFMCYFILTLALLSCDNHTFIGGYGDPSGVSGKDYLHVQNTLEGSGADCHAKGLQYLL